MVWVVCADSVSGIRHAAPSSYYTITCLEKGDEDVRSSSRRPSTSSKRSQILSGRSATPSYAHCCSRTPPTPTSSAFNTFRQGGLLARNHRGDCTPVEDNLGQNFSASRRAALRQDVRPHRLRGREEPEHAAPLTEFGRKLVVKAVQGAIELQWKVCFRAGSSGYTWNSSWTRGGCTHNRLDIGPVFRRLVAALRRLELLRWLANTEISIPLEPIVRAPCPAAPRPRRGEAATNSRSSRRSRAASATSSGLAILERATRGEDHGDREQPVLPESDIEVSAPHPVLPHHEARADLALELAPFCNQTPSRPTCRAACCSRSRTSAPPHCCSRRQPQ